MIFTRMNFGITATHTEPLAIEALGCFPAGTLALVLTPDDDEAHMVVKDSDGPEALWRFIDRDGESATAAEMAHLIASISHIPGGGLK